VHRVIGRRTRDRVRLVFVASFKSFRAVKVAGLILVICLLLVYAGGLIFGFTIAVSALLIRVLELLGEIGLPAAGCVCLAWFGYKLLLEPVRRRHKLERLRDYRARRFVKQRDDPDRMGESDTPML
jgi:hypothetical protein